MSNNFENKIQPDLRIHPFIFLVFFFTWGYHLYLGCTTQMIIVHDAKGYENLGHLLYQNGFIEYFKTGPNREPIYPLLVSLAVALGDQLSCSYQTVQIFFQILLLWLTQYLTLLVFKRLKIDPFIMGLIILYIGISPSLINSTFSLFSEIATYPVVLLLLLVCTKSWPNFLNFLQNQKFYFPAFLLGSILVVLTFIKGVFELVVLTFLPLYFINVIRSFVKKEKKLFSKTLVFILIFLTVYYMPLFLYKLANKRFNGNFTLTGRGQGALYASTTRRMEPLNHERFLSSLAFCFGEDICHTLFNENTCYDWTWQNLDHLSTIKIQELSQNQIPNEEIDKILIKLSIQKILQNPFQAVLMMFTETLKMFFWESTQIGFVIYPTWLANLYDIQGLEYILKFSMALLTFLAYLNLIKLVWQNRSLLFVSHQRPNESFLILFFSLFIIICYVGSLSFFFTLTRYYLTIIPLYLVSIAFFLQSLKNRILKQKSQGS